MPTDTSSSQLQALLDLAAQGDGEASRELINRASHRLLLLTRRMLAAYPHLKRWEQTDDVFQNAVMRLYRSLSDVRPENPAAFFGLATTQIRRTLIDLLRHHFGPHGDAARHLTDGPDADNARGEIVANVPTSDSGPLSLVQWAEFHEAVSGLPDDERAVFDLTWYAGITQVEAAGILQISERTVIRRLNRARLRIHETLGGEQPPVGDK